MTLTADGLRPVVQDCLVDSYKDAPKDGTTRVETTGCPRVLRGGSWSDGPQFLCAANRDGDRPGNRYFSLGFRLART